MKARVTTLELMQEIQAEAQRDMDFQGRAADDIGTKGYIAGHRAGARRVLNWLETNGRTIKETEPIPGQHATVTTHYL